MEQRLEQLVTTFVPAEYEWLSAAGTKRWKTVWKQRLIVIALIFSDVLLALLVWEAAYVLQGVWGQGEPSDIAVGTIGPCIAVWVALRALLGLYPGYGWDGVEELRRAVNAALATLAITAIFAVTLQVGESLSRLMLAVGFAGLLFLSPLARYFVKRRMNRVGLWGKPVVILSSGEMGSREKGAQVTTLLQQRWELGYQPIAVFDYRLAPAGGSPGSIGEP